MEAIYQRPRDYDFEHEGDDEDIAFYVKLLEKWQPRRVMELASGKGQCWKRRTVSGRRSTTRPGHVCLS
jgi:hypothetical protein